MDEPAVPLSSGRKRSSSHTTSPSTRKRIRLASDLPQPQLMALNDKMGRHSQRRGWQRQINDAGDDISKWHALSSDILIYLSNELAATDLKANVVTFLLPDQAVELLNGFSHDEFSAWMEGVQKGVKAGDWEDLIDHRAYHPANKRWLVSPIISTAKLGAEAHGSGPSCLST